LGPNCEQMGELYQAASIYREGKGGSEPEKSEWGFLQEGEAEVKTGRSLGREGWDHFTVQSNVSPQSTC